MDCGYALSREGLRGEIRHMGEPGQIKIKVELTSVLRIRLKTRVLELELPVGSTLRSVAERLTSQYRSETAGIIFGADGKINIRFAVDKRIASLDEVLEDGSEVLVLGQIGGG